MFSSTYFPPRYFHRPYFPGMVVIPPTRDTLPSTLEPRRWSLLFGDRTLSVMYDRRGLDIQGLEARFPIRFTAKGLPILYMEKV